MENKGIGLFIDKMVKKVTGRASVQGTHFESAIKERRQKGNAKRVFVKTSKPLGVHFLVSHNYQRCRW